MDSNTWKPIKGVYDAYINIDGCVIRNGKAKKSSIAKTGYKVVTFSIKNKSHTKTIHSLLADAFIGPRPDGMEVLHINGDKLDNRISNLRYGTRKENVADAIRHGTATIGLKNGAAKLKLHDIIFIKDMSDMGFFAYEIAPHFKVCVTTIRRVLNGHTYKGVLA